MKKNIYSIGLMLTLNSSFFVGTNLYSNDVTGSLEYLGNPFNKASYANNIWDMEIYDGKLYFGHGNSSNVGPNTNAGPIPIVSFDLTTEVFVNEYTVPDEQIDVIKVINGVLTIPGHDPRESWQYGNYFELGTNGWEKIRTIPHGVHNYDMHYFDGKLFAAIGSDNYHECLVYSSNNGQSWSEVQDAGIIFRRFDFIELDNRLYSTGFIIQSPSQKRFQVIEYQNGNFTFRSDLNFSKLMPGTSYQDWGRIKKVAYFDNKAIYLGGYRWNDHHTQFQGAYVASSLKQGSVDVDKVSLNGDIPFDIEVSNGAVYILASERISGNPDTYVNKVYKSMDLNNWSLEFLFTLNSFARSFEIDNDVFYFGIGTDTGSSGSYSSGIKSQSGDVWRYDLSLAGGGTTNADILPPSDDAFVRGGTYADDNYGSLNELVIKNTTSDSFDRQSYLKFDLSSMTGNADTARLILTLKSLDSSSVTLNLSGVYDDDWTEGTITWNNKPSVSNVLKSIKLTSSDVGNEIAVDVKDFVNGRRLVSNYASFVLAKNGSAEITAKFHSNNSVPDKPYLEINGGSSGGGGVTDPDTFSPSDDAYVRDGSYANDNYGDLAELIVKDTSISGYDRRSYLEFDLSSMTGDADTAELVLTLKSLASSPATINLYEVNDDSWSEGSITWNNKPAPGSLIQSITLTSADVGNEIAIDVKSFVNAERSVNDRASFVFTQPGAADNAVKFHSKDAASGKPVLEINGGSGSSGGGGDTAPLLDDAYVRGGTNSSNNYGGSAVLAVKDASNNTYDRRSYLKFDLSGMSADTSLAELVLTLKSMDSSSSGVELRKISDDSWTEGAVTWNDKPASGDLIQSFTLTTADVGNELAIDVTSYVNDERSNDGEVGFVLQQQGVADVLVEFHSSDAVSGGPLLEVGGSSGGAGDIIVEAEDLSRTSGGAGTSVITDSAASGGEWVKLNADGVGDWIEFTVPDVKVATYDISVEYRTHSLRGQYQTKVVWNGGSANIGSVNDQYAASGNDYVVQAIGPHTFTSAGSKRLRFEVTGKNSGSSGYSLSIDKIQMIKQ